MHSNEIDADAFSEIVSEEFDALPDDIVGGCENVAFVIEDLPANGSHHLLGLYSGINLTHRGQYGFGELPDRITLFREPLLDVSANEEELRHQIRVTLVHEIAHFYGINDERLRELGWG